MKCLIFLALIGAACATYYKGGNFIGGGGLYNSYYGGDLGFNDFNGFDVDPYFGGGAVIGRAGFARGPYGGFVGGAGIVGGRGLGGSLGFGRQLGKGYYCKYSYYLDIAVE